MEHSLGYAESLGILAHVGFQVLDILHSASVPLIPAEALVADFAHFPASMRTLMDDRQVVWLAESAP